MLKKGTSYENLANDYSLVTQLSHDQLQNVINYCSRTKGLKWRNLELFCTNLNEKN